MKSTRLGFIMLGALALLIMQVSCGNPLGDDPLDTDGDAEGYTGSLSSALTLTAGSYRVSGDWSIEAALVLQPGTTLLFDADASITVSANGSINAVGTAESPITFTSSKAIKAAGDWDGVCVYASSSRFEYCSFSYADEALEINSANNTVDHCAFASNVIGLDASSNDAVASIRNSTFTSNETPFQAGRFNLDDSNTFTDNTKQYVELSGDILQGTTRQWALVSVPLVVTYDIYVDGDLTIAPGARLLFQAGRDLTVSVNGSLTAVGESGKRIAFSSAKAGTKARGDWEGVYVQGNSSSFEYCDFEYAAVGLDINGDNTTINQCAFNSNTIGLEADSSDITAMSIGYTSFSYNGTPFLACAAYDLDDTNSFSDNTNHYIEMYGDITEDRSWTVSSVPLRFENSLYVVSGGTLHIGAGTVLSFSNGEGLNIVPGGELTATGTSGALVKFTSAANTPIKGSWAGIAVADNTNLSNVIIEYAGNGLDLHGDSLLTISNSIVRYCTVGIYTDGKSYNSEAGITFTDNTFNSQ